MQATIKRLQEEKEMAEKGDHNKINVLMTENKLLKTKESNTERSEGLQLIIAKLMQKVKHIEKENKELLETLKIKKKEVMKLNTIKN